jgi:hypothetical protein
MITETSKCPRCDKGISEEANFCGKCGFGLHECPPPPLPKTSVLALIAFIFGSLVASPYFIFASVPAFLFGIASSIKISRNRVRLGGKDFSNIGIVFGCLGLLVLIFWLQVYRHDRLHDRIDKARMDMRSVAVALEAYRIDSNLLPLNLNILTSPIDYLSVIPSDPFSPGQGFSYFHYKESHDKEGYCLWSIGPDRKMDFSSQFLQSVVSNPSKNISLFYDKTYDVTNGTFSTGDIWRLDEENPLLKQ